MKITITVKTATRPLKIEIEGNNILDVFDTVITWLLGRT